MQTAAAIDGRDSTIDSLRGLAAFAVVVHHLLHFAVKVSNNPDVVELASAISIQYVDWGRFGVVLFFLISGYVVPEYLIKGGSLSVFLVQRLLRIYPVFWVSVVVTVLYQLFDTKDVVSVRAVIGNATLFPQAFSVPWLSGVYWPLNVEVLFYLLCAAVFLARSVARPVAWQTLCVLAVASTVLPILSNHCYLLSRKLPVQFTGFYLSFLISGVLLRQWSREAKLSLMFVALLPFIAVPLVAGAFFPVSGGFKLHEAGASVSAHVLALIAFLCLVVFRRGRLGGWWLRVGRSSYSLYLFHWPVCALVIGVVGLASLTNLLIAVVAAVAGSFVVAEIGYRCFEKPSIEAGRRWRLRFN